MRRSLQSVNQQLPRPSALHAPKLFCVHHHDGLTAVQRDVLRPVTVSQTHQFAETGFGVLEAPAAVSRNSLVGCFFSGLCISGHADQINTATRICTEIRLFDINALPVHGYYLMPFAGGGTAKEFAGWVLALYGRVA